MTRYLFAACVFVIILPISWLQSVDFVMKNNKIFRFNTFMSPCEEQIKEAYFDNIKVHRRGGVYSIDYDFHLSWDVSNFKMEVLFSRCSSREALDTCEQLAPFATNLGCKFATAPNAAWTAMVNCSTPQLRCPVKKGLYKFRNCKLDLTLYNFMPVGRYYWRVLVYMSALDKRMCVKCEGTVIN